MTVTTQALQRRGYTAEGPEVLPSGRYGYHYEFLRPEEHTLQCDWCSAEPKNEHDPRIIHSSDLGLCLCIECAEELTSSLLQDLARVVEKEGFVAGTWLAGRETQIKKDVEELLFSGRVQRLPGGSG